MCRQLQRKRSSRSSRVTTSEASFNGSRASALISCRASKHPVSVAGSFFNRVGKGREADHGVAPSIVGIPPTPPPTLRSRCGKTNHSFNEIIQNCIHNTHALLQPLRRTSGLSHTRDPDFNGNYGEPAPARGLASNENRPIRPQDRLLVFNGEGSQGNFQHDDTHYFNYAPQEQRTTDVGRKRPDASTGQCGCTGSDSRRTSMKAR